MAKNPEEIEEEEVVEEKVNIRHTITAEETFTLAKDVFDIRCFIKNVYANRAVISRRLNILSLTVTTLFTLLYAGYVLLTGFTQKLAMDFKLVLYILLGVYGALIIVLIIIFICQSRANTKRAKKIKSVLKIFKLFVRLVSLAISVLALVLSGMAGGESASGMAVNALIILFSVIMLIMQVIPLLFGGFGKMARWLLSPVKAKHRFSSVVVEWYELAVSGTGTSGSVKKVSKKYFEDIGTLIDNALIPALGKKYISTIKPVALLNVVEQVDESDRPVLEGVIKNVFKYATECGYVMFDPCKDLNFEGSVEEEEKKKSTLKDKFMNVGKKFGKSMLDKYISSATGNDDKK